jgi:acyl-homoserine lactone acylase PvdQ
MMARNLAEMKGALAQLQIMGQNIMVGTVQGDIYYVRNGRVPIRAPGTDPSRPIAGSSSTNEGIHPFSDLVQLENPRQGYMHNNNVTPFAMMKDSPLTPESARFPYLYNASRNAPRHQRGDMMTELLDAAWDVTAEQAIALAFDTHIYRAETWVARLKAAWETAPETQKPGDVAEVYRCIQQWDRRSEPDSKGALAFFAFKQAFEGRIASAVIPPDALTGTEIMKALHKGTDWLKTSFESLEATYGDYFRVGRRGGERTYPVGGGSLHNAGMATVRAIGFRKTGTQMVGSGGQTSTQIVIMTNPPESYTVVPLGVSDHQNSAHWDDQAEKLFSKGKAAPTWFMNRRELLKHVTATTVLKP